MMETKTEAAWKRMVIKMLMRMAHGNQDGLRDPGRQPLRAHGQECRDGQGDDHGRPPPNESTGFFAATPRSEISTDSFIVVPNEMDTPEVPKCFCDKLTVILRTQKAGNNFQRMFFSCPKYKKPALRCNFFQWTPVQPFCEVPATRLGAGPKGKRVHSNWTSRASTTSTPAPAPPLPVPQRAKKTPASSSTPTTSTAAAADYQEWMEFKEFQEFRKHKAKQNP